MRVISQSPDPLTRMHTMTKRQGKSGTIDVKALLREDEEFLRALVRTTLSSASRVERRKSAKEHRSTLVRHEFQPTHPVHQRG
jgi:hypothetical protein